MTRSNSCRPGRAWSRPLATVSRTWLTGMLFKSEVASTISLLKMKLRSSSTPDGHVYGAPGAEGNALATLKERGLIARIARQVEKGFPISIAFSESEIFPPVMGQMIAVGEETGKIDEVLFKLSKYFWRNLATFGAITARQ